MSNSSSSIQPKQPPKNLSGTSKLQTPASLKPSGDLKSIPLIPMHEANMQSANPVSQLHLNITQAPPVQLNEIPPWLQGIDWSKSRVSTRSEIGEDGVYFIRSRDMRFVIKGSKRAEEEMFYNYFAQEFGLNSPEMIGLSAGCQEWTELVAAVDQGISELNIKLHEKISVELVKDEEKQNIWLTEQNGLHLSEKTSLLVMSMIEGYSLKEINLFNLNKLFREQSKFSPRGIKMLEDLGKCIVMDLVIGNLDRFNLAGIDGIPNDEKYWGNMGNFMFSEQGFHVIDTTDVRSGDENVNEGALFEALKSLADIKENLAERVRCTLFTDDNEFDIGVQGKECVMEGIQKGMEIFLDMDGQKFDKIVTILAKDFSNESGKIRKIADRLIKIQQGLKVND
ncbi:hypothetical protein ACFL96_01290 [Thermoproteota archaeon]